MDKEKIKEILNEIKNIDEFLVFINFLLPQCNDPSYFAHLSY